MRFPLLLVTLLAVLTLLVVTSLDFWTSPHLREEGDIAANALQIERAREGIELLGPYSKHGFNHPGPASFYLQARSEPLFPMFPSLLARHCAAQAVLGLLVCLAALWLLRRGQAWPTTIAGGLFLLTAPLLFLSGGSAIMLIGVWGPTMTILPMALVMVAAARVIAGDLVALPFAVAAAVPVAHNHVLTLPALTLIAIAVIVARARHSCPLEPSPSSRRGRLLVGLAIAIAAAGAMPILIDQLTSNPGNITLMVRWLDGRAPGSHPWLAVLTTLGQAFTDPLVVLFPRAASILAGPLVTAGVIGAYLAVSVWLDRYRARPWRPLLRLLWLVIALTALLARGVSGKLGAYLFYYLYGLVGVLNLAVADGLTSWWSRRNAAPGQRAAVLVVIVGVVGLGAWLSLHPLAAPAPRDDVGDLIRELDLRPGVVVELVLGTGPDDDNLLAQIPTHALRLRRAGCRVVVPDRFVVMCGREMAASSGCPAAVSLEFTRRPADAAESRYFAREGWGVQCRDLRGDAGPLRFSGRQQKAVPTPAPRLDPARNTRAMGRSQPGQGATIPVDLRPGKPRAPPDAPHF
ncbi:MAG: hypothetical protein IPK64_17595 [bacterium]|nr:hypothetical protein [bacterium]